jgi:hypothetical protein
LRQDADVKAGFSSERPQAKGSSEISSLLTRRTGR